jgi:hypothetical protein
MQDIPFIALNIIPLLNLHLLYTILSMTKISVPLAGEIDSSLNSSSLDFLLMISIQWTQR